MKKTILFFLLFFPISTSAGLCAGENYKIIQYNIENTFSIKSNAYYDLFLFGPLKTENIKLIDTHYIKSLSSLCEYKDFDKLTELSFSDLNNNDKIIFIGNIVIILSIFTFLLFLLIKGYKNIINCKHKSFKL